MSKPKGAYANLRIGDPCADCAICKAEAEGRTLGPEELRKLEAEGKIELLELAPGVYAARPILPAQS